MKQILLISLFISVIISGFAQNHNIGIGTTTPDSSAALEISSSNQGFLMPHIALATDTSWPLAGTKKADGMMIYNTANSGTGAFSVAPGLYYWRGNQWFAVYQVSGPQYNASATFDCSAGGGYTYPQTAGFTNGQSYSGTIYTPYTVGNAGAYPGDVVTINGITLTRSPGILSSGSGQLSYKVTGVWTGVSGTFGVFPLNLFGSCTLCNLNSVNTCSITLPLPLATFQAGSLNCTTNLTPTGNYQLLIPMTSSNTKSIFIQPTATGTYSASTNTVNGVTFSGSGYIQQNANNIILTASGTPAASGTFSYTETLAGQTCTFPITFLDALVTDCNSLIQSGPSGQLVHNQGYSGTITWSYTNGSGASYLPSTTSATVSGLTITSLGFIPSGSGSVIYSMNGFYSGPTGGTVSIPITLDGVTCQAVYGDNIRNSLNEGGCNSCGAYDAASPNTWIKVTQSEYNQLINYVTNHTVAGVSSATLATSIGNVGISGVTGATNVPTNVKIPGSNYITGFAVLNPVATVFGYSRVSPKVKFSTTLSSGYATYGSNLPDETIGGYSGTTTSYFVIKTPTTLTTILASFLAYYDGGGASPTDDNDVGYSSYYGSGSTNTLSTPIALWWRIQAITTSVKQW